MNVDTTEFRNKKDSFSNQLKALILSGQLKPGDKLPTERDMAAEYGISRGSVNQGLLDLEREGFIRVVPRKGTYVEEYRKNATPETLTAIMAFDPQRVDSSLFLDLMSMRILIECECARLAAKACGKQMLSSLRSAVNELFSAQENEICGAIYHFHRTLVLASGNSAYAMIFQSFEKMLRRLIALHYSDRNELVRNLPLYSELSTAIMNGDGEKAGTVMAKILSQAKEYMRETLETREEANG